jgi:adenylate cyclase
MGDGVLVEFSSAVNAVAGALELQRKMAEANERLSEDRRIVLRIGLNLGDVISEGSDIYGDGVNIAARLETLAEPGGIAVSQKIHDEVEGKLSALFEDMGEQSLKNMTKPVRVFGVSLNDTPRFALAPASSGVARPSIAILPFANMSGDPEQEYFSDGIREDIITELSRCHSLAVVARNSSFQFRGPGADLAAVRRALGVHYIVEGSSDRQASLGGAL